MSHYQLIDVESHKRAPYSAKDFDEQQGYKLSLRLPEPAANQERPLKLPNTVEVGIYLHWFKGRPRDIAIDVSCMSGCTEACRFCAAADLSRMSTRLSAEEMIEQVRVALEYVEAGGSDFLGEFQDRPLITVSFAGMGEPSKRKEEIIEAIQGIRDGFQDRYSIQFIVSTLVSSPAALKAFAQIDPPIQSLQVSLHGPDDATRHQLLHAPTKVGKVMQVVDDFHNRSPQTEIKINYLLIRGENDDPQAARALARLLGDRPYYVKVSYLNETVASERAGLARPSTERRGDFLRALRDARPEAVKNYIYGSENDVQMSCGQLASYADPGLDENTKEQIRRLFDQVCQGNAVLFVGAGANLPGAPTTAVLANNVYSLLRSSTPFGDTSLDLASVTDLAKARGLGGRVFSNIQAELARGHPSRAIQQLACLPWHSVFSTNYDTYFELAADAALKEQTKGGGGRVLKRVKGIRKSADLVGMIPRGLTPLIKLHGSIEDPDSLVVSDNDYIDHYAANRDLLFKYLEVEAARRCIVFLGYSLRDHYIRMLINANRPPAEKNIPAFAVLPSDEFKESRKQVLRDNFGVELISATAIQFSEELDRLARQPVVLVSGSSRPDQQGTDVSRRNLVNDLAKLAGILAAKLSSEGISIINGATATDKFGYMVAADMSRRDPRLVRTMIGSRHADEVQTADRDELEKMVNVVPSQGGADDVIDAMTDMAHVIVLAGGSAMTLREYSSASSKGRVVIPIAIGDRAYASDLVHGFMEGNVDLLDRMEDDPGFRKKAGLFSIAPGILTKDRLSRLKLGGSNPEGVADAVLEILRDLRMRLSR